MERLCTTETFGIKAGVKLSVPVKNCSRPTFLIRQCCRGACFCVKSSVRKIIRQRQHPGSLSLSLPFFSLHEKLQPPHFCNVAMLSRRLFLRKKFIRKIIRQRQHPGSLSLSLSRSFRSIHLSSTCEEIKTHLKGPRGRNLSNIIHVSFSQFQRRKGSNLGNQRSNLETTTRHTGERYVSGMLWRSDDFTLPNNREAALKRFHGVERRLTSQREYADRYVSAMKQHFDLGHARLLAASEILGPRGRTWYLPHHGV